ncbi:MAG: hypothetical protein WBA12_05300, partial [Catalinimonas sp.]
MKIDLYSTLYLLAALQSVLLIGVIWRRGEAVRSERYLTGVLGAVLLTLLSYVGTRNQLFGATSLFINLSGAAWYAVSPLLYLYCRCLVGRGRWHRRHLGYFSLSAYLLGQALLFHLFGVSVGLWTLFDGTTFFRSAESYSAAWILAYLLNSLVFAVLSVRTLGRARLTDKHRQRLRWLRWWLGGFTAALVPLNGVLIYWWRASLFYAQLEFVLVLFYAVFVFSLVAFSLRFSHYFTMMANDGYRRDQQAPGALAERFRAIDAHLREAK